MPSEEIERATGPQVIDAVKLKKHRIEKAGGRVLNTLWIADVGKPVRAIMTWDEPEPLK